MDNTNQTTHQATISNLCQQLTNAFTHQSANTPDNKATLSEIPRNAVTGKDYKGFNLFLLWAAFREKNFTSHEWATFKQWSAQKETIRKGEKGTLITGFKTVEQEIDGKTKTIISLQLYHVFNRSQLASKTK